MPTHTSSTTLPCSLAVARDFLGKTAHLPDTSDPDLELEVLNAPEDIVADSVIEFRISAYGFKQTMKHRYVDVSDVLIVAEQIDGPTRSWVHRQKLADNGDGTCTLTDEIEFEPPGGMLGFVMTAGKVLESIQGGMEHRYETLIERLQ